MGYRVKGTLKLPDGTLGTNCEIEFTSRKNFTPVLTGMGVSIRTDSAGAYDVTLEYGAYAVILRTGNTYPTAIGQIIVASDTVVGQDLPTLLEQSGWQPATPEYIQQITKWLAEANASATKSTASASAAKVSETNSKSSEIAAEAYRSEVAVNTDDVRVKHSDVVAKSEQVSIDSSATQAAKSTAVSAADTATQKALAAAESEASAFSSATRAEASAVKSADDGAAQAALAKSQADRAKAEADRASQISGLGTVSDAIGLAALPLPDVWVPFSDSLRMITGYGRDVLVGSDVVARMVNFARSTTATYIGKDGLLKTAAVNEPRFEKEGLLVEGQSTNLVWISENLLSWPKNRDVTLERQAGVYTKITAAGGTMGCYLAGITLVVGKTYTVSFWGYADAALAVKVGTERESVGTVAALTTTPTRYSRTFTATQEIGTIVAYTAPGASGSFYVGGFQLEELPFASSYIPTAGAAVTRAHDVVTIPWALNLPPTNMTVAFNYDLSGIGGAIQRLIEYAAPTIPRYLMQINQVGDFESYCSSSALKVVGAAIGPGSLAVAATALTRHALKLTGKAIAASTPGGQAGSTSNINIGSGASASATMYGHIRNFRIWHRALTDDQLKAVA